MRFRRQTEPVWCGAREHRARRGDAIDLLQHRRQIGYVFDDIKGHDGADGGVRERQGLRDGSGKLGPAAMFREQPRRDDQPDE